MPDTPFENYTHRLKRSSVARDRLHRTWSLLGNIRLALAVLIVICMWQWWNDQRTLWAVVIPVGVVATVILAFRQRGVRSQRDAAAAFMTVNQRGIDRLSHAWDALPSPPDAEVDRTHPYAWDLNVIGKASVAQRIGTPVTHHGWQALYECLLSDRATRDVAERQQAVAELGEKIDARQAVEAVGVGGDRIPDPAPLLQWAASNTWLQQRAWLRVMAVIGPAAVVIAAILWGIGVAPWVAVLVPMFINGLLFFAVGTPASQRVQKIAPLREAIDSYEIIIEVLANTDAKAPMLQRISQTLNGATLKVLRVLATLSVPTSSVLYFPMQIVLMWDLNVLALLERWQQQHGARLPAWLQAMGEWEGLAALSVLEHDHPAWSMPIVNDESSTFSATALAHPLLPGDIAVPNDVTVGPRGTFLFVTGSNMSGKSTLLRAIGTNAVLAQAGAPVAAQALSMPPLRVASCMRVEDSLEHGVSFFMAELQRLKAVLDRAQAGNDRPCLYLLDEILQGTNTAERQIASRRVLGQLTRANAIGAVSSHDLELIDASLADAAELVHFSEQFIDSGAKSKMTFDYRLRPGLATSSNAIRLMELLGFEISD